MITLYGIKNCDTVKKARAWLAQEGIDYVFHDFRSDGLSEKQVRQWCKELGWETLLNRRGTTWRKLPESLRDGMDAERAIALMLEQPAIIKRPLLDLGKERKVGFKAVEYQEWFGR